MFVSRQKNSRRRGSSNDARAPRIMRARALVNFDLGSNISEQGSRFANGLIDVHSGPAGPVPVDSGD